MITRIKIRYFFPTNKKMNVVASSYEYDNKNIIDVKQKISFKHI